MSCLAIGFALSLTHEVSSAQDTDTSVMDTQGSVSLSPSDVSLNVETCEQRASEQEFTLSGTYNIPGINGYTIKLVATTGSSCTDEDICDRIMLDEGGCSCLEDNEVSSVLDGGGGAATISTTFKVEDLFETPCAEGEERTVNFMLKYKENDNPLGGITPTPYSSSEVKLLIDLNPPAAPTEPPNIIPAEEALVITVPETSGDIGSYEACVWADGLSRDEARCKGITAGSGERFEGLTNDVLYHVIYAVYDEAGNRSGDSPDTEGTPASVLDFAEVYSGEYPGGERGGCQSTSTRGLDAHSTLLIVFILALITLVRRWSGSRERGAHVSSGPRSSLIALFSLVSGVLMLTGVTLSDAWSKPVQSQSPMTSSVTFTGGAYQPRIDEEFLPRDGVQRPYERVFQDQSPVMFVLQVERHIFQDKGILSLGGGFGYWSVEGDGLSVTTVTETTEMSITPYSVYGAYRFDIFKEIIPVIPVLKLGLNYYTWSIYDGSGEIASFVDGSEASGGTFGWFYSVGAHFLLDFLDQEMAWAFDRDAGVNHSYLSFEYQSAQVDDFGDPNSFRLGNDIFLFGITLDL